MTWSGDNSYGRADAPSGSFTSVSAGADYSCGLRTDGTAVCWGWNRRGQTDAPTTAPTTTSTTPPDTSTTTTVPEGDCYAGLVLSPGDRCTYPGSADDLWIDDSSRGHFIFFTSGGGLTLRDSTINGVTYTLVASRQADGTWLVEAVG